MKRSQGGASGERREGDRGRIPIPYQTILELASDPISIRNEDGWFVDVNTAACKQLAYEREEYLRLHVSDVAPPEQNPGMAVRLTRLRAGETIVGERRMRRRDGTIFEAENSSQLLPGGLILTISRDLTARRNADQERRRLVAAVEQTAESIMLLDAGGEALYVNPAFTRLHGFAAEDVVGRRPGDLVRPAVPGPNSRAEIAAASAAGLPWAGRIRHRRKDGSNVELDLSISPLRDEGGVVVGWVEIGRDVGRERALEEQLRQSQKMEAVGRLAGGIAHDFNNLLAGIRGYAELIHRDAEPAADVEMLSAEILRAADRGKIDAERLLTFARQRQPEPVVVDLGEVVAEAAPLLHRIADERTRLTLELSSQPLPIRLDPVHLEQVLLNLVINARDAISDIGSIVVATRREEVRRGHRAANAGLDDGPHALLSVTDTGIGISPEALPLVFEPFFTTKPLNRGTGLGLSIVYSVITAAHGRILVESKPGAGSRFDVFLPLVVGGPTRADVDGPAGVAAPPRGDGLVLVVDDEEAIATFVKRVLQRSGYVVATAGSAEAALARIDDGGVRPMILVTDILLPGMNGIDLARAVQSRLLDLPILFISGYEGDRLARDPVRQDGEFLKKPFTSHELLRAVRTALEREPAAGGFGA